MTKGILGRKVGMTQLYLNEVGDVVPVTVIEAGPCNVLQIRSEQRDGYEAVQLGFLDKKRPQGGRRSRTSQASRSERGHVADIKSKRSQLRKDSGVEVVEKADCEPQKFVREIRGEAAGYEVGVQIKADFMEGVAAVDVVGINKGRGYAGVMKRHNFAGQRATHGVKKCHRYAGSTGQSASPSRMIKGRRMAGRYGGKQITVRNLKLVKIDAENNLLMVYGAVPGPKGGMLVIRETNMVR